VTERSDEALMVAYRDGESGAFRILFSRYSGLLRRVIGRDLFDKEETNDLMQQTFLQLHRARFDYRPEKPLRPWLLTIALNLKRQYFRTKKRRPTVAIEDREFVAESVDPNASFEAARVRKALAKLRENQREAIVLHWFEGLSFAEIAEVTGTSTNSAKVRAHRGYGALKKILGEAVTEEVVAAYSSQDGNK
jgi:RNA polymerase sigma-70 factor (ECF subfamily)